MLNLTNQLHDINPGIGPEVGKFDTGNGFGTRVFWITAIPDSDLTVDPATGTAHLHVVNDPEYDYNNFADSDQADWNYDQSAAHPHGFFNATVSFDIVWKGPVTETDNVKDTANGFAGTFYQNDAQVTWSASSTRPVGAGGHFTFTSNPGDASTSSGTAFSQLGTEQNGVFFPSGASLQPDPVNPALTNLVVDGSSTGGVHIQVQNDHGGKDLQVKIDGADQKYQAEFPAAAISRIIINSGPGDNHIEVANDVRVPAVLMGSYGNDHIQGGGGRTIIVGGLGSDHLQAGPGETILIAGTTDFDRDPAALSSILTEWSRTNESYLQRVANLSNSTVNAISPNGTYTAGNYLNAATVHDDGAGNHLEGGPELDWIFANLDGIGNNGVLDTVTGHKHGDILTGITL